MPAVQTQPFTLREAATHSGIDRAALRVAIAAGELAARRTGRFYVIEPADLERYVAARAKQRAARRAS